MRRCGHYFGRGNDMAFASEFEVEDELERECRLEECKVIDDPSVKWDMPSLWALPCLLQCRTASVALGPAFLVRVSGFDWNRATPPPEAHDPGRPVAQIHRNAITRIVNEIARRTSAGNCVALRVQGYADPFSEAKTAKEANDISAARAKAFSEQLWERIVAQLPKDSLDQIKQKMWEGKGAALRIWFTDTPAHRHLNRRVLVGVWPVNCEMTLPGASAKVRRRGRS